MAPTGADVVVVGSGIAGALVAADLTAAGLECVVLEAGDDLPADERPVSEFDMIRRLYWHGGLELNTDGSIVFTRARCVGGGSIVNQALLDELDEPIFARWRDRSGLAWLDEDHFGPVYGEMLDAVENRPIPVARHNRAAELVTAGATRLGWSMSSMRRAETNRCDGNDCISCLGGCPIGGKQDSSVTTLPAAVAGGATVLSGCSVRRVREQPSGVSVEYVRNGRREALSSNRVVLAAGSIGTTALLLASGFARQAPRLGHGFHCHPQWLTVMLVGERVDAAAKAFGALGSSDKRFSEAGFKFETNFTPPIVHHLMLSGYGQEVHHLSARYHETVGIEILVRDDHPGRIAVRRDGSPVLHKKLHRVDLRRQRRAAALLRDLSREIGADEFIVGPRPFSVHQMGGAALSDSARTGVVGPDFAVHGSDRVHVVDSALFPSSTGRNPSLTIMALARMASRQIAAAA